MLCSAPPRVFRVGLLGAAEVRTAVRLLPPRRVFGPLDEADAPARPPVALPVGSLPLLLRVIRGDGAVAATACLLCRG